MSAYVCTIVLFIVLQSVLSFINVTLRPTFHLEGCTFLKGQLGKPLAVSCYVEQTPNENDPQSGTISINGLFYPTTVYSKFEYEHTINSVTDSLHNATVGCTIMYASGDIHHVFRNLFVMTGIHYKPILSFPETLNLDECERIVCEVKETIRPKPVLTFNVSVYQIESVLQLCNDSTVCKSFAHLKRLERKWYRSQILCCVSSEFFQQLCSDKKELIIQFPPKSVNITFKVVEEYATYFVVKITCIINAASPSCNISWVHAANATKEGPTEISYKEDGIYTSEYKLLILSNTRQQIRCQSKCSLFDKTPEENFNIVGHSFSKDGDNTTYDRSNSKFVAALVIALLSILCNIILGYIVLRRQCTLQLQQGDNSNH